MTDMIRETIRADGIIMSSVSAELLPLELSLDAAHLNRLMSVTRHIDALTNRALVYTLRSYTSD